MIKCRIQAFQLIDFLIVNTVQSTYLQVQPHVPVQCILCFLICFIKKILHIHTHTRVSSIEWYRDLRLTLLSTVFFSVCGFVMLCVCFSVCIWHFSNQSSHTTSSQCDLLILLCVCVCVCSSALSPVSVRSTLFSGMIVHHFSSNVHRTSPQYQHWYLEHSEVFCEGWVPELLLPQISSSSSSSSSSCQRRVWWIKSGLILPP